MDDLPALEGELYAGLVLSTHPHANITVDYSAALVMEGVVDYVCVNDVPGSNMFGMLYYNYAHVHIYMYVFKKFRQENTTQHNARPETTFFQRKSCTQVRLEPSPHAF